MSKVVKLSLVIAGVALILGLCLGSLGYVLGGSATRMYIDHTGIHVDGLPSGPSQTETINLEGVSSIVADLSRFTVEVLPGDSLTMEYSYHGSGDKLEINLENGTLTAKSPEQNRRFGINFDLLNFGFFNRNDKNSNRLVIRCPENTELALLDISSSIGRIHLTDVSAKRVSLSLDLGIGGDSVPPLYAENLHTQELLAEASTGNAGFRKISASTMDISLDLGSLTLAESEAGEIDLDSASGSLTLTDIKAGRLTAESDLGAIRAERIVGGTVELDCASGSLTLVDLHTSGNAILSSDLGSIQGRGLITQGLSAECASGSIELEGDLRGINEVSSDLGSITVHTLLPRNKYDYAIETDLGSIYIDGEKVKDQEISRGQPDSLTLSAASGSIHVEFGE